MPTGVTHWSDKTQRCVAISLLLSVQCELAFVENQEETLSEESHHSMETRVQVSCWDLSNWCANLRTLWDRRLIRGWHEKGNIVIHIWKKRVRAICYKWNNTEILDMWKTLFYSTLIKIKVLYWHQWFSEEPWTSMEPFKCRTFLFIVEKCS